MAEPSIKLSYSIDDLLSLLNDELHGRKNAFSEPQKIRHLNKAVDEVWKAVKGLKENYWVASATLNLDGVNTEFALPNDFAEMRLVEVTSPADYAGLDVIHASMTSPVFRTERQATLSAQAPSQSDQAVAIPGQLLYDVYGPDATGVQRIMFSRLAPVALTLRLWYVRFLGQFSIPKQATETLTSLMSPYVWAMITYAVKSLIKSESSDAGEFGKWEQEWRTSIDNVTPAAKDRQSADADTVEGFIEM